MRRRALFDLYAFLDRRFRPEADPNYDRLVVASDSSEEPVHRWFRMKEAFSPHLFLRLLKELRLEDRPDLRLLDPFSGSGTTLTSAMTWAGDEDRSVQGLAFEVNSFLHLLSSAKVDALMQSDAERLETSRKVEVYAVQCLDFSGQADNVPELAAFNDRRYFKSSYLRQLLMLRASLDQVPEGLLKNLLSVALAAAIEPSSNLRRDGRALRYVPNRVPVDPRVAFARKCKQIASDLRMLNTRGSVVVLRQDGRVMEAAASERFDLAIFSPPYPNNIDYTEVYKLESWLLQLTLDQSEFQSQREATMRSHPSISWLRRQTTDAQVNDIGEILEPILKHCLRIDTSMVVARCSRAISRIPR